MVYCVVFEPAHVPLLSPRSQGFAISMSSTAYIEAGTTLAFPVRNLRHNTFVLQRYPIGTGPFSNDRCRRTTNKKAQGSKESRWLAPR